MTKPLELPTYQHPIRPLSQLQIRTLLANLDPSRVYAKQGRSYMKSYDIKAMLTRVFGFGGFSADVIDSKIEGIYFNGQPGHSGNSAVAVMASATVRLYVHQLGATYTETAVCSQNGAQIGEVADFAMKTAESDALKRAATYLGTQFGLSLYQDGNTNDVISYIVEEEQRWPLPHPDQLAQERGWLEQRREAIADAQVSYWNQVEAQREQQGQQQVAAGGPPEGSSLNAEQHADAQALVQRATTMRQQQQAQQQDDGPAAVLDPSL